ncbi:MAG: alpha/beta hydrolase [Gammaproteobacteria bacterium]|nr:alpha/beta hydrolase [Gammaproteobacteria bacterium]
MQEIKHTLLPNDCQLAYVREGKGPTTIFIHGAMGDYRAWRPQWSTFTKHLDCISYSRRYSYPNENPLIGQNHSALIDAEDLLFLMDALNIENAFLVGSSYGGFTALAAAVAAPDRVKALVSVEAPMMRYAYNTERGKQVAEAFLDAAARPAQKAFAAGDDKLGVLTLTSGIVGKPVEEIPDSVVERRMQNARAARSLALSSDEFPLLEPEKLAALPMPVILIRGADTAPIHQVIFSEVAKIMPQAQTLVVDNSGHSVSQQQPEAFNAAVQKFLAEVSH